MKLITFFTFCIILIMGITMIILAQIWIKNDVEFVIRSTIWMIDDFRDMRFAGSLVTLLGIIGTVSSIAKKDFFF